MFRPWSFDGSQPTLTLGPEAGALNHQIITIVYAWTAEASTLSLAALGQAKRDSAFGEAACAITTLTEAQ